MDQQKIARINELYRKSKAEGLTEAEKKEQKILRTEYMDSVKRNLRSQLNNIDIEEGRKCDQSRRKIWKQKGTLEK